MSTHDRPLISWTCVEPSLWELSTFFCCNASGFQMNLYVVDICLFLGLLQLHQISLKDDASLVSEHNIIAYRFLTKSGTFSVTMMHLKMILACSLQECTFKVMHSALPFFSNGTNLSLISFVSKFVVSRKIKERKCVKECSNFF